MYVCRHVHAMSMCGDQSTACRRSPWSSSTPWAWVLNSSPSVLVGKHPYPLDYIVGSKNWIVSYFVFLLLTTPFSLLLFKWDRISSSTGWHQSLSGIKVPLHTNWEDYKFCHYTQVIVVVVFKYCCWLNLGLNVCWVNIPPKRERLFPRKNTP